MKSVLSGTDVLRIRASTGWAAVEFSALLGVSASTIYRWELRGDQIAPIEPLQQLLLAALGAVMRRAERKPGGAVTLRRELTEALAFGGTLRALHVLLAENYTLSPRLTPQVVVVLTDTGTTP